MTIPEQKQKMRLKINSLLNKSSSNDLRTFSSQINVQLLQHIKTNNWRRIGLFSPIKNEPDIWPVFDELIKDAQKFELFFPRVNEKNNKIEMIAVRSRDQLTVGKYGIFEPRVELDKIDPSSLDVIIIPGIAFDRHGNRLGRGKGYYDTFLAPLSKHITRIGVCFPVQVIDLVPSEKNDQAMNLIVY